MTSLAEDESACQSVLDDVRSALTIRRRYSSDPVLATDVEHLLVISARLVDDCPHVALTGRRRQRILRVADLVFGHGAGAGVLSDPTHFYRSLDVFNVWLKMHKTGCFGAVSYTHLTLPTNREV